MFDFFTVLFFHRFTFSPFYFFHLYDWVEEGEGLGDSQHDKGEIEEDNPERRKHLPEKSIVGTKISCDLQNFIWV